MRIRYNFGVGFVSVGRWRPMTWYSLRRPMSGKQSAEIPIMSLDLNWSQNHSALQGANW